VTFDLTDLRDIDAWVLDVDGCLVSTERAGGAGGTAIAGAVDFVRALHGAGHAVRVVTNASQRAPHVYAEHLRHLGFEVGDDEFVTAGSAAAAYLAERYTGGRILVIGEDGLLDPLAALGVDAVADNPAGVAAVVVGAVAFVSAAQLDAACLAVADNGAALYVTVDTPWFHGGRGRSVCVSAAVAHSIAWVTGVDPIVLGKPSDALAATLRRELGGDTARIAVVGDAPAEIILAREMGARSVAVLTGALTRESLDAVTAGLNAERIPDLIADSVAELTAFVTPSSTVRP
jgi:NagD protein